MTRAQIEAARERVAGVLDELGPGYEVLHAGSKEKRDALCARLVSAVLGHPDGKAPKAPSAKQPGRGTRLRFAR